MLSEIVLALLACVFGVFLVAGVISTGNSALIEWDTLSQKRNRRLREILVYLKGRNANETLIRETLDYYQSCFESNIDNNENDLLEDLPDIISDRLSLDFYQFCHIFLSAICDVSLFENTRFFFHIV